MGYEWDEAKAGANKRKHGVSFDVVLDFAWVTSLIVADDRADYGEPRWVVIGRIEDGLYSLAYTFRGDRIRVISLRRASRKERSLYEQTKRP